ncbi:MAG: hypothetical protein JSR73_11930 [Proteobacteria bacterium]|nr:hypothetical protein [Pseudomonadota bacterium]
MDSKPESRTSRGSPASSAGRRSLRWLWVPAAMWAGAALADSDAGVSLGAIYTDNVTLTDHDPKSATIAAAGVDLAVDEQRPYADVKVAGDVRYLKFLNDAYPNETVGNATGSLRALLVPERFAWVVRDNFGQQQLVLGAPDNPANRETVNYLSTGPELNLRVADQTRFLLTALASTVNYQRTNTDNRRVDVLAALIHDLSPAASVSLNAEGERVRYQDDVANPDFDRSSVYGRYVVGGARTQFAFAAGASRTKVLGESGTRPLYRAELTRVLNTRNKLKLAYDQESFDAATALRNAQGDLLGGQIVPPLQRSNDPYRAQVGTAQWQYRTPRTAFDLTATSYEERHDLDQTINRNRLQLEARVDHAVRQRLGVTASVLAAHEHLAGIAGAYDDRVVTAGMRMGLGRHLSLLVEAQRVERRSDIATDRYVDDRVALFLRYGLARKALAGPAQAD